MAVELTGVGLFTVNRRGEFVAEQELSKDTVLVMAQGVTMDGSDVDIKSIKSVTIGGKKMATFVSPKGRLLIWTNSRTLEVEGIEFK